MFVVISQFTIQTNSGAALCAVIPQLLGAMQLAAFGVQQWRDVKVGLKLGHAAWWQLHPLATLWTLERFVALVFVQFDQTAFTESVMTRRKLGIFVKSPNKVHISGRLLHPLPPSCFPVTETFSSFQ